MKSIQKKDEGAEVRILQELLNLNRYNVAVDGIFGNNTQKIVKHFQAKNKDSNGKKLKVDGLVGDKTWQALIMYDNASKLEVKKDRYTLNKIKKSHPCSS